MNLWRRKLSRPINKCPFLIGVPDQTSRKWEVTSYALVTKKLLWERIPQEPISNKNYILPNLYNLGKDL